LVIDRGKRVQPRRHDLKAIVRHGSVDPDSNYCFGEGGAGTYSDGKLYTRSHKRGDVRDVIELLALHGAPAEILVDARPHIGSNRLPKVVTALRERLERAGVRFLFERKLTAILRDAAGRLTGARLADGSELGAQALVLATGHSARDVFERLLELGVTLEPKGFAAGVRVEHPQPLIDAIQYGALAGHAALPSAAYKLAHTEDGRGVFSFCMCPGGFMVPAATEPDGLVLNGMSLSKRSSRFANSGLVVAIEPEDVARAGLRGPLAGVALQRRLEQAALQAGGGEQRAPATRVTDFLARRGSSTVPASSYGPGLRGGDVAEVLDASGLALSKQLRRALPRFERRMRGFLTQEAVLCAVESRTAARPAEPAVPAAAGPLPCGRGRGLRGRHRERRARRHAGRAGDREVAERDLTAEPSRPARGAACCPRR
jgi:uncharacterized FAD-dependent dehydrogenase